MSSLKEVTRWREEISTDLFNSCTVGAPESECLCRVFAAGSEVACAYVSWKKWPYYMNIFFWGICVKYTVCVRSSSEEIKSPQSVGLVEVLPPVWLR